MQRLACKDHQKWISSPGHLAWEQRSIQLEQPSRSHRRVSAAHQDDTIILYSHNTPFALTPGVPDNTSSRAGSSRSHARRSARTIGSGTIARPCAISDGLRQRTQNQRSWGRLARPRADPLSRLCFLVKVLPHSKSGQVNRAGAPRRLALASRILAPATSGRVTVRATSIVCTEGAWLAAQCSPVEWDPPGAGLRPEEQGVCCSSRCQESGL